MSIQRTRMVYRALLLFFPTGFRREFGPDMVDLFAARMADETTGRGRARLWGAALFDLFDQGAREWVAAMGRGISTVLTEGVAMEGWVRDVRFGARALARQPGFTVAAVGTLAPGIGAVVALFSVVHGVLLAPLPYPDSERIVVITKANRQSGERGGNVDHPDFEAWRAGDPDFLAAGFSTSRPTLLDSGDPEVLEGALVTQGLLGIFGIEPALGRDLTIADDVSGGPRVAVASWAFWQNHLGGRADVLGITIDLSGNPWEIVGVAPADFNFPSETQLWMPLRQSADEGCDHGCNILEGVGRLPAGGSLEETMNRLAAVDERLAEEHPDTHRDSTTELQTMRDYLVSDVETAVWILMVAVSMVLLIACANVANLTAVRSSGRSAELAVRAALGAGRARIVKQLLAEALVLSALAGTLGLLLAAWGIQFLIATAPEGIPRIDTVALDGTAVLFTLGLAAGVACLFGLLPARHALQTSLATCLRTGGTGAGSSGLDPNRLSPQLLLAGEVALSLILLLGSGLLFRTLEEMRTVDLGFTAEGVERFRLSAPESRYDTEATQQLFAELDRRLAALPGVEAVGHSFGVPFASGSITADVIFPDRAPVDPADAPPMGVRTGSPGFLDAMGLTLLDGRWIEAGDIHGATPVAVLNETAARSYFPEGDALGSRINVTISWGWDDEPDWTVVGIVRDVRSANPTLPDKPTAYLPSPQLGASLAYFTLRRAPGIPSVLNQARSIVTELDPALAITSAESVSAAVARQSADTRFYLTLLSAFSAVAIVLAAVGLYGVVAYAVSRRAREIGIRRALGAESSDVVGMVMRQGVAPALLGLGAGLVGAWFASRAFGSLLFGVRPYDPTTVAGVTGVLLVVVALATAIPARRASGIAPAEALREG